MVNTWPNILSFNGGVVSPLLEDRTDLEWYFSSCLRMENMIATPWGAAMRRPGTRFVVATKDSSKASQPLPFDFSGADEQAYIIEAGDAYMRFAKNRAQIVVADTDAAIANGTFTSNITGWDDRSGAGSSIAHDATNGRLSLVSNGTTAGHAEQDVATTDTGVEQVIKFRVLGAPGDEITFQVGSSSTGAEILGPLTKGVGYHCVAFTPGASPFYVQFKQSTAKTLQIDDVALIDATALEIASPYAAADVAAIKITQSADVLFLAHGSYPRYRLNRYGHTTWSLVEIGPQDGPYLDENTTATTLTPGATTGLGVTLTASATTGINGGEGFKTTDVGRIIRMKQGSTWGWCVIVGRTSTTVVTVDIKSTLTTTDAKTAWRLGLWSATTGYPAAVMFHEERIFWFGARITAPGRFDGSVSNDFPNFTPGTGDSDPIAYQIGANQVPNIRWAVSQKYLMLGCVSGVARVSGGGLNDPMTPTNPKATFEIKQGCASIQPIETNTTALFVDYHRERLYELAVGLDAEGQDVLGMQDLTIRAEHVTKGKLAGAAWQGHPWGVAWMYDDDGQLLGFSYQRAHKVTGWHTHRLGGAYAGGDPVVEGAATIPGPHGGEVWLLVKRTIDGATVRYLEYIEAPLANDADGADAFYVDSGLTYDVPVTITAITAADPVVVTAAGHGLVDGDRVRIRDVEGMTELNNRNYTAAGVAGDDFALNDADGNAIDGTAYAAYERGGAARKMATTFSDADHLEGATVHILGDGADRGTATVTAGAVTLARPAAVVQLGLPYPWRLQPMDLQPLSRDGSADGRRKRVAKVIVSYHRSNGIKIGPDEDNLTVIPETKAQMDAAPVPATGKKEQAFLGEWELSAPILLGGDQPFAATIRSINVLLEIEGG